MYSIIKDNLEIGIVDKPTYIRMQDNGAYGLCDRAVAQGVVYDNTPYHVWGMPEFDEDENVASVMLVERDSGKSVFDLIQQNADLKSQSEMLTECLLEMSEIVYAE